MKIFKACWLNLVVLLFGIKHHQGVAGNELKITFWIDALQQSIYNDIAAALKQIDTMHLDVAIKDSVMIVTREHEQNDENMVKLCEILSTEGIGLVIDWSYYRWDEGEQFLRTRGIPIMRVDPILRPYLQMFSEFMQQKKANNVVLIMQNAQDKEEAMMEVLEGFPFRTVIVSPSDERDFVERLILMRPPPSYYAIFARGSTMNTIFERINNGTLFERPAEWHFVFLDPRDRVFKYKKQVEFATKFTVDQRALCRAMQMEDSYCMSAFTFQRALLLDILRSVIEIQRSGSTFLPDYVSDCNVSATSKLPEGQNFLNLYEHMTFSSFTMYNAETIKAINQAVEVTESGITFTAAMVPLMTLTYNANITISFYSNEHEAKTDLAIWRGGELRNINQTISPAKKFFRIGTTYALPWSYYKRHPHTGDIMLNSKGDPIWEGYCIDFIHMLSEKLNFNYEIVAPKHGDFGRRDAYGRWDGVIGDLVSGETDFIVAALKMYSEREEVVDFLPPYFEQTGISIVMRKPVRRTSLFKFMTVLRREVWLSILAALVATALMIWLLDTFSPYSSRNNKKAYPYPCREFTLRESFWFALTSFTPQGGGEAPKAISGRILVAAYWLFVVLMLATFTANLAAFLTVERMQAPVQSLEQLARQSRINYTVVHESDTHQYFINMKFAEDTLYRMWKELSLNATKDFEKFRVWDYPIKEQYGNILLAINGSGPVRDAEEGFRKVNEYENADYAFIHDSSEIKYEVTRNCNLTEVGEVFAEQPYAIAVQQGSHLGDELSYAILILQKDRYFEDLRAKYWNESAATNCPMSDSQEGITLESLGGVFIATLFGLILALITLTLEVFYYKKQFKKKAKVVTQVKPATSTKPQIRKVWQFDLGQRGNSGGTTNVTPPPSFLIATQQGKPVPITFGGNEFKPQRLGLQSRRDLSTIRNKLTGNKVHTDHVYLE